MGVNLTINYGNGAQKSFSDLPFEAVALPPQPHGAVHVHDVLLHARELAPGLNFSINEGASNRAGLVTVVITQIDGVDGLWQVAVNGNAIKKQKQMTTLDWDYLDLRFCDRIHL
jgi:hypothetical protein